MHVDEQRVRGDNLGDLPNRLGAFAGAADAPWRASACQCHTFAVTSVHETEQCSACDETSSGRRSCLNWTGERSDQRARSWRGRDGARRLVGEHRQTVENLIVERLAHIVEFRAGGGPLP